MLPHKVRTYLEQCKQSSHGKSERVSVTAQVTSHTMRLNGLTEREFFSSPEVFVSNHLLVSAYYDLDSPSLYYDMYNIEAEALGQKLIWVPGMFPEIDGTKPLIRKHSDLDRLRPPDPLKDGRMPFITGVYKRLVDLGLTPSPRFCAPFTLAANIRGLSSLITDILTNPEFVHRLFHFVTVDVLMPWIEKLRMQCGKNLSAMAADALASLPITNINIIEEYALGYILKLREEIGNVAVSGWWGERFLDQPERLWKLKRQANTVQLKGYDPDVWEVGPEKYVQFAKMNGLAISLGIDSTLLTSGPETEIVNRVERYIKAMKGIDNANIFLNEVTRECPSSHVHAAVQAVRFFRQNALLDDAARTFSVTPKKSFREWIQ